jgi:DNA topoisomerase-1
MIVEREEEIEAFVPREYWTVEAKLAHRDGEFTARLVKFHGKKFEQFDLTNADDAHAARDALFAAAAGKLVVGDIQRKQRQRRPAAPFTTSTLQQEAARKLGMATSRTMRVAQGLYEGVSLGGEGNVGLITYMRTDSTHLSGEAIGELRQAIEREFGRQGLPEHAMVYKTKSKNAQEAHEAIRPTSALRTPKSVAAYLTPDQLRLYELVWKRAVACQMKPATLNTVSVEFPCGDGAFRATGTTVVDPGFLAVYEEGRDQKSAEDEESRKLPALEVGESVPLTDIAADQHFTEPPPRYSEASLVKTLEEYGIGRPSTYASIIQTLLSREYVILDSRRFKPTDVGRAVAKFLTAHFTRYVDYDFTAKLEDELDAVSRGEEEWRPLMAGFWKPFKALVDDKMETVDRSEATGARLLGDDPRTGKPVSVRLGRYGPYAALGDKDKDDEKLKFASLLPGQSMHTITLEEALELFKLPRKLGHDGDGEEISAGIGRFGPFVKQGKLYASIKGDESAYTITLERARELIREKQELIANRVINDFGDGIQVLNGRYGPYITNGEKNAKVPKEREPKSLSHEECKALLEAAPVRRGRGAFKKTAAKKAAARKAPAKKPAARKPAAKKASAKKSAAKKTGRKTAARKSTARKAAGAKPAVAADADTPPFDV